GQLLSMQIDAKQTHGEVADRLELRQLTLQTVSQLADSDATLRRLVEEGSLLLRVARATGAARAARRPRSRPRRRAPRPRR
ncbi:hypothetical protein FGX01_01695, partial [Xylella fastidiosa subsp. multiplex]|nr:hypothetical protein [Xylella fastidiosa subsp. multiplex]